MKRRVHRVRVLTSIAEGISGLPGGKKEEEELPFGLKRVAITFAAPAAIDVLAFAGGARNAAASSSNNNSGSLLSLALGQTAAANARRRPAPQVATPARTVSGFDLLSSKYSSKLRSEPIQISGNDTNTTSSSSPLRSSSSSEAATNKRASELFEGASEKKDAAAAAAPFEPSLGSWTQRVAFFPLPAPPMPPLPQQQPVALNRDSMSSQRSSSENSGSSDEESASPPLAGASPKSVLSRGGPAAKSAAAENSAVVFDDAPSDKGSKCQEGSDGPEAAEAEAGWRLRFARRWRRERLYRAIGLFPRSPPVSLFDSSRGVDALAAAVVGAFEEADAAVEFGDGEW